MEVRLKEIGSSKNQIISYVIHSIEVNQHIGKYFYHLNINIKTKDQFKKNSKGIRTINTEYIILNYWQWSHFICIPTTRYISLQKGKTIQQEKLMGSYFSRIIYKGNLVIPFLLSPLS